MKTTLSKTLFIALLYLTGCGESQAPSQIPLVQKNTTKKLERENTLFAFVGEKIELKLLPYAEGSMDDEYLATYKILQRVYGTFKDDKIVFHVFSHKGYPRFAEFRKALIYVSKAEDYYYHEKYQFDEVYKTEDGRWAGLSKDYNRQIDEAVAIKPQKINFKNSDIPDSGNYVEDLFRVKRNGVLTHRGLFGDTLIVYPVAEMKMFNDSTNLLQQPKRKNKKHRKK